MDAGRPALHGGSLIAATHLITFGPCPAPSRFPIIYQLGCWCLGLLPPLHCSYAKWFQLYPPFLREKSGGARVRIRSSTVARPTNKLSTFHRASLAAVGCRWGTDGACGPWPRFAAPDLLLHQSCCSKFFFKKLLLWSSHKVTCYRNDSDVYDRRSQGPRRTWSRRRLNVRVRVYIWTARPP
jgi:hypothetical protein